MHLLAFTPVFLASMCLSGIASFPQKRLAPTPATVTSKEWEGEGSIERLFEGAAVHRIQCHAEP